MPRQQIGQRGGQLHPPQNLPARGAIKPRQIQQIEIGGFQSQRGVGQDGKERDQRRDQRQREIDALEAHPDQDQGRDRHHRRHLQDHRIGIKRALDQPALAEQDRHAPRPRPARR